MLRRFALLGVFCMAGWHAWVDVGERPHAAPAAARLVPVAPAPAGASGPPELGSELEPEAAAEPPPSPQELRIKAELETQLLQDARGERITTRGGHVLHGRVLETTARSLRLLRSFGDSGEMELTLPRSEIVSVEAEAAAVPAITLRDVRFRMEFPAFNLYRRPPFTIATDQRFFAVEAAVRTLEELHADVLREVGPLVSRGERGDGIQLLFFSDEAQFAAYRDRYAPALGYAAGFYSTLVDRLVIFDQAQAQWVQSASRELEEKRERLQEPARAQGVQLELYEWHSSARRELQGAALRANRSILRHEGAHQLFHAYGVHSRRGGEPLWLVEGLAAYFEPRAGEESARAEELRAAAAQGQRFRFCELIDYRSRAGFGELGGDAEVALAYAQSWFAVDYFMRNEREALFEYIRTLRDPARLAAVPDRSHSELLARLSGRTPRELERELSAALEQL